MPPLPFIFSRVRSRTLNRTNAAIARPQELLVLRNQILATFNVPKERRRGLVNWAKVSVKTDSRGLHVKTTIDLALTPKSR